MTGNKVFGFLQPTPFGLQEAYYEFQDLEAAEKFATESGSTLLGIMILDAEYTVTSIE